MVLYTQVWFWMESSVGEKFFQALKTWLVSPGHSLCFQLSGNCDGLPEPSFSTENFPGSCCNTEYY